MGFSVNHYNRTNPRGMLKLLYTSTTTFFCKTIQHHFDNKKSSRLFILTVAIPQIKVMKRKNQFPLYEWTSISEEFKNAHESLAFTHFKTKLRPEIVFLFFQTSSDRV